MLVLKRNPTESLTVNGPAEFVILAVKGNRVRIGIKADKSVTILRSELINGINELQGTDGPAVNRDADGDENGSDRSVA